MDSKQTNKAKPADPHKPQGPARARRKASTPAYLQRKLRVSDPKDAEEKEADAVAADVKRRARPAPGEATPPLASAQRVVARSVARLAGEEEEEAMMPKVRRQEEEEAAQPKLQREEEEEAAQPKLMREEEEEAAQPKLMRQPAEEEETAHPKLWRKGEEEEAQTKLWRQAEEEPQATAPSEGQQDTAAAMVEQRIQNSRGNGTPLPDTVLKDMEQQFGQDFSRVVIHTDNEAAELCQELNARAFTIGSDIYFAPGEFTPETETGRELLAHELTHVVQQNQAIKRKAKVDGGEGSYSYGSGVIVFDTINIPDDYRQAYQNKAPLIRHRAFSQESRTTRQQQTWKSDIKTGGSVEKLNTVLASHPNVASAPPQRYIFKVPSPHQQINGRSPRYAMGSLEECARQLSIPSWNRDGRSVTPARSSRLTSYDVDHIVEEQLGARSESGREFQIRPELDSIDNFQLLRDTQNTIKMNAIKAAVREKITIFQHENTEQYRNKPFSEWQTESLLNRLSVKFLGVNSGNNLNTPDDALWTQQKIDEGTHLQNLIDAQQIQFVTVEQMNVRQNHIWIFNGPDGGYKKDINKNSPRSWRDMFSPFEITSVNMDTGEPSVLMRLAVNVPSGNQKLKRFSQDKTIDVLSLNGSDQVGYLPMQRWSQIMQWRRQSRNSDPQASSEGLEASGFSPLTLEDVEMDPELGLVISGQILPTLPIIGDANIQYRIAGNHFDLSKTFNINEISLPSPIELNTCNLTISAGTRGFNAEGRIDFLAQGLGEGYLAGSISPAGNLALEGGFDFDSELFDRSHIEMWYRDGSLGAAGELAITQPNKIRGIQSATVNARFEDGVFSALGEVSPSIPAVEQGSIELTYSEEAGLDFSGDLQLAEAPGIRSGQIHINLLQQDGDWRVSATGTAQPAIPGIDSQLTVGYDDGAFTAEFSGAYQRGMLSGRVTVGATNRAVGEDGRPSGDPLPEGALNIYGAGSATIQIAPWLQGTAGIRFDPNGEVTVSGEIGIPNEVEIFARREINKSIFSIAVQVPIVPGIVAEAGGGLGAVAGIGPGVIDEMRIGITYNPAHEEDTRVTGDAHLSVPADAGLRLSVRAGIGLGITGASATGGLDIGGTLGIEGAAEAGVHIDWTPSDGLDLSANLAIHAQPSFTFDIGGYVSVRALGFSVYDERWQFASYSFGSGYRFGIRLPVHYHEGEPFDISLDDVQFEVPDIDTNQLLRGLIGRIA